MAEILSGFLQEVSPSQIATGKPPAFHQEITDFGDVIDYVDLLLFIVIILDTAEVETPTWRATSANGIP